MRRALRTGFIAAMVCVVLVGLMGAAFATKENDFFQFCTTKAYGWPAPWRIDYCECEGSRTVYPATSKLVNLSLLGGSGFVGFALFGAISLLRQRPH